MHRILAAGAMVLLTASAAAQTLPSPKFANPPVGDSSNAAATTNWVRSQGYSTGGAADVATAPVLIPGSTVARTVVQRAATTFNVLDYGAVADGVTDLAPALNAIAAQMPANTSNEILIPAGSYALKSAVVFNGVAPILEGQGFTAGPNANGASGTWITISGTGYTPILFENTNARGAQIKDIAFSEVQPAPAAGWTPAAYDYVVRVQNALGQVTIDNVLMSGVTQGLYADNSGRIDIKKLDGQFFNSAVELDDCLDIPHIGELHAWPYSTSNAAVISYQEANENTLILHRVDGIFVDDLFSLGAHAAVYITNNATGNNPGTLTKGYFSNLYADFVTFGVWIDSSAGVTAQFANVTTQNNDQTAPGSTLVGGRGLYVTGNTVGLQIDHWRSNIVAGPAIDLEGYGANVRIGSLWANTFGTPGSGTPAVGNASTGSNPGNTIQIDHSWLQGVAPLYLYAGSNGGQEQPLLMNAAGDDADSPRAYSVRAGASPSIAAVGSDSNINLSLNGKGSSGVQLQSSGQTVLRVDGLSSGIDDLLFRSGAGTMNLIAEGGDANIDDYLVAKGATGGVRLQANGSTSLRTDNPNGVADDLLIRPGSGTMSLTAEGSDANVNVVVSAKGSGKFEAPVIPTGGTVVRSLSDTLGDHLSGKACGMALDGTADDTAALQTCLNNVAQGQVLFIQPGLIHMSGAPTNPHNAVVQLSGNSYGTAGTAGTTITEIAPNTLTESYLPSATSEVEFAGKKNTVPEPGPVLRLDGLFDGQGTTTTNTVNTLQVNCNVNAPVAAGSNSTDYVWCQNNTLVDNGTGAAQDVAYAANVIRPAGTAAGRNNTWSFYGMNSDQSAQGFGDPYFTGGQTEELDYQANGLDNTNGGGTGVNGARMVSHLAGARWPGQPNYPVQLGNLLVLTTGGYNLGCQHPGCPLPDFVNHAININSEWAISGIDFTQGQPLSTTLVTSADQGGAGAALPFSVAANPLVTVVAGMQAAGTGIPAGDTVTAVDNATGLVTLAAATTGDVPSGTSVAFTSTAPAIQLGAGQSICLQPGAGGCIAFDATNGAVQANAAVEMSSGSRVIGTSPGSGFARSGTYVLEAATSSAAATRLTSNGAAPSSSNCINPPANVAMDLFIEVVGIDTTAAGNVARYRLLDGLLYRGASAAATQVINGASNAAPNGSIGSGSGAAFTAAADTTNGCLALSVTPPNGDAWHWAARVRTTEVQ